METPIQRIVILALTQLAHMEFAHSRVAAVIWYIIDDGETRTAVGAIGERVAVTPIIRIKYLAAAIVTRGDIRRDQLILACLAQTFADFELGVSLWMTCSDIDMIDTG